MKSVLKLSFVIASLAILLVVSSAHLLAIQSAPDLFRQALAADAQGDYSSRDRFLHESLRVDPEFELAHWYRGEVRFHGEWKSIVEVSRLVSSDPRWEEYQTRLSEANGSLDSQVALARWCGDQNLTYEEKWHWLNVLSQDSNNREALGSLGLRYYEGELLTEQQIRDYQRQEKQIASDYKRHTRQFQAWIGTAARGDKLERVAVLEQFATVKDELAIPALIDAVFYDAQNEKLIRKKLDSPEEEEFLQGLRHGVVTALSEMKAHEATLTLIQIAIEWPDSEIRTAASEALKYRKRTDYMPQLMAWLAKPLELGIAVHVLPNGEVTVHEDLAEEGPMAIRNVNNSSTYLTQTRIWRPRTQLNRLRNIHRNTGGVPTLIPRWIPIEVHTASNKDFSNATNQVANTRQRVEAENAHRKSRNQRIINVLQITTGEDLGSEPRSWWDAWAQYNELETPEVLPVYDSNHINDYSHVSYIVTVSCFVAGTPVWTQSGPVSIETIQVGDMVLSQDPFTGELDYRPITNTTVRKPSPTVKLGIRGETIIATRGHRFWLAREGWQMAKFLKAGDRLWSTSGSVLLDTTMPSADTEAFNLEVGQFHTYFVGKSKILVHDNGCPLPNPPLLPGVKESSKFAAD